MDEFAIRTSRHEATHTATAITLGWEVTGASRSRDLNGVTHLTPRTDGDILERGIELATILAAPMIIDADRSGCTGDLSRLAELVSAGVPLEFVWSRAEQLQADPDYRRIRDAIERALIARPVLDADEIARLTAR